MSEGFSEEEMEGFLKKGKTHDLVETTNTSCAKCIHRGICGILSQNARGRL